ncbi:spore germination protein [Priestia flexa]|nr:spore germination protein [Priestia flexa]
MKKLLGSNYKVSKVQISAKQFFILSILFAVGDAIIYIPSLMAQEGLHTMWIAGLLGIVQAFIIAFIYTVIGKRILNNGYIYTLKRLFGSWIGQLLTVLFLLYVMVDIVLMIYEMGSFIVTMVMPTTPIESVLIAFLVVVIIGARLVL